MEEIEIVTVKTITHKGIKYYEVESLLKTLKMFKPDTPIAVIVSVIEHANMTTGRA